MKKYKLVVFGMIGCLMLSGCQSKSATVSKNTQETTKAETAMPQLKGKSTFNPIYMGSDTDYKGDKLEITTAENGAVLNKVLADHQAQFTERELIKISDRVYVSMNYGMANVTFIVGTDGIIVVDTNENNELSSQQLADIRKVSDKPIKGIIYSHGHYIRGTSGLLTEEEKKDVQIWAHEDHFKVLQNIVSDIQPAYFRRLLIHHGMAVPYDLTGEDAFVGGGLGNYYLDRSIQNETIGYMPPTNLVKKDQKFTDVVIGGVNIRLEPKVSDAADNLTIYLPDDKVVINNFMWPNFANLYTLRGEAYRDPKVWIDGVDSIIDFEPEYIVGVHGKPIIGKEKCMNLAVIYRDGIQYVYDQTIKGINEGKDADEIIADFTIPKALVTADITKETYGELEHYIRGIYDGILGWYGNDPIELHPVSKEFEASRIIQGFGGIDAIIGEAKTSLENKEYAWSAQLATYVLEVQPENEEAKQMKADSLRKMSQVTTATTTRYFYTTNALDLEGKLDINAIQAPVMVDIIKTMDPGAFVNSYRLNIDPKKAESVNIKIAFQFTGNDKNYGLTIRNGIGVYSENIQNADVTYKMNSDYWFESIIGGTSNLAQGIKDGHITVEGNQAVNEQVLDILNQK